MSKCRYNDGIHVVRKAGNGDKVLLYCENCSESIKWVNKNHYT